MGRARFISLPPFGWFLVVGIIATNIVYSILTKEVDIIGSLAAVTGVFCVVLVANRNIWNYLFGLVNVSLYAYISFKAELYGDAALNAFYYLPMQFIGFALWRRRMEEGSSAVVESRRMTGRQRLLLLLSCMVTVLGVGFVLSRVGDPQPYKDAATTVLSVIAQYLMVKAYAEQWILWVVVNVISVVMWVLCAIRGESYAALMVVMWVFYLMNSLNGWVQWARKSNTKHILL